MGLAALLDNSARGLGSHSPGQSDTKRNYYALFLLKKNELPDIGSAYENTADGGIGAIIVYPSNLALVCKDLCLFNKGMFYPKKYTQGSKDRTVNITRGQIYADEVAEAPTGEVTEMFHWIDANYYQNIDGWNAIRDNSGEYDAVMFTNNTAEIYRADAHGVQILNIGDESDGNNNATRNGGCDIAIRNQDGQVSPIEGIVKSDLGAMFFTIQDSTLVNATKGTCSGKYTKFTRTTASTLSSILFTKSAAVTCVTWSIKKLVGTQFVPATDANDATITQGGLVAFPSAHPAGATKYAVTVVNETGIYGVYYLEINI